MRFDLSLLDPEQFSVDEHILNGEQVYLVQPQHISCRWTQHNKIFRSSVWNAKGELISAGFPKFVNWGENPDNFPLPSSLKDAVITEKLDGSLLIVSRYKGNWILRTRGTVDATKLENGSELEIFKRDYLPKLDDGERDWGFSILFEWISPANRIVIRYSDKPLWKLIGIVSHKDYSLETQKELNFLAEMYDFTRPPQFKFDTIEQMLSEVDKWEGKEGVVIYTDRGQSLHKVKSAWYLVLHRMKESLSSLDKVVDTWFSYGKPPYLEFQEKITNQFDFELWQQIRGEASKICDAWKEVKLIVNGMNRFIESIQHLSTRKDKAQKILSAYSTTNRSSMVFSLLDGKILTEDQEKKLVYQCIKKS